MKLRTQLILLFLALAVVPLTGLVLYSYAASVRAMTREARESNRYWATRMNERLASVQQEADRRIELFRDAVHLGDPATVAGVTPGITAAGAPAPPPPVAAPGWVIESDGEAVDLVLWAEAFPRILGESMDIVEVIAQTQSGGEQVLPPEALAALREGHSRLLALRGDDPGSDSGGDPSGDPLVLPPIRELSFRTVPERMAQRVLRGLESDSGLPGEGDGSEIPFAVGPDGTLIFADQADRERVAGLPLAAALDRPDDPQVSAALRDWVVVGSDVTPAGLRFGVARPIFEPREESRRTALANLAIGLALVGLSILGMLPMSHRLTRSLDELTASAERLATGELSVQVPVRGVGELGRLARAFNRMAGDLEENQRLLLAGEESRREQELTRRLLEAENERKTHELEEARRFQLSLLPRSLPKRDDLEVAVAMRTATEVGGDYYDFHLAEDGTLTVAVGDATGHGATAGTMVTVLKGLFTAQAAQMALPAFLTEAAATVRRMELGRLMMALCLARFDNDGGLRVASAGMPPVLIFRAATATVEEIELEGIPLGGGLSEFDYQERTVALASGDVVLMMSDGFPELPDPTGEPLGYPRAEAAFLACAERPVQQVVAGLLEAASAWNGGAPLADDATFVVLRRR
jgi:serine phosphatase RsbU (regulator of sigma subunit)